MTARRRVDLQRRHMLLSGGLLSLAAGAPAWAVQRRRPAAEGVPGEKRIALRNLHTDEAVEVVYWREAAFVPESLAIVENVLRDFRNGERHAIDPQLLQYLYDVAMASGAEPCFDVISGYRSPQTNEMLRERSGGVAQRSLHLQGRAIDVRLAGVDCLSLATRAQALTRGGVGYYRKSDFVHLDTGAFRTWRG